MASLTNLNIGKVAQALAPAAGAMASPYDPRLGAAVAGGLAEAVFPTEESIAAKKFRELQMKQMKQNLKFAPQREARAASQEARLQKQFELGIDSRDRALAQSQFDALAMGQASNLNDEVGAFAQQALKEPVTPDFMQAAQRLPAFSVATKASTALQYLDRINTDKLSDGQLAVARDEFAKLGIQLQKGKDGKWKANDLSLSGSNKDGTLDQKDLELIMSSLKNNVAQELIHGARIEQWKKSPLTSPFVERALGVVAQEQKQGQARSSKAMQTGVGIVQNAISMVGNDAVLAANGANYLAQMLRSGDIEQAQLAASEFIENSDGSILNVRFSNNFDPTGADGDTIKRNFFLQLSDQSDEGKRFLQTVKDEAGNARIEVRPEYKNSVTLDSGVVEVDGKAYQESVHKRLDGAVAALAPAPDHPAIVKWEQLATGDMLTEYAERVRGMIGSEGFDRVDFNEFMKTPTGLRVIQEIMAEYAKKGGGAKDPMATGRETDTDRLFGDGGGDGLTPEQRQAKKDTIAIEQETGLPMSEVLRLDTTQIGNLLQGNKRLRDIALKKRMAMMEVPQDESLGPRLSKAKAARANASRGGGLSLEEVWSKVIDLGAMIPLASDAEDGKKGRTR